MVRFVGAPGDGRRVEAAVLDGDAFAVDERVRGPVVIELPGTSIAVAPDYEVTRDRSGSFILTSNGERAGVAA
jgi:hypothetical protein